MSTQKNTQMPTEWENVKMRKALLQRLRKNKKDTGVPIITFVEKAVTKELDNHKNKLNG